MTVCIAAICANGKRIVVAADRMFTLNAPVSLEFETGEKKIDPLAPSCTSLSSGNSAYAKEIVSSAVRELAGSQTPKVEVVAETLKTAYIQVRANKVRELLIVPWLGPDYLRAEKTTSVPTYLKDQAMMFQNLVMQANNVNLMTDFLVTGLDEEGARLAYIGHPGTILWMDKLGYGAIGSGAIYATTRLALAGQTRATSLAETLYRVYEAKRASEVAPGVGDKFTDMAILRFGGASDCSNELLQKLGKVFDESRGKVSPDLGDLAADPALQDQPAGD